MKRHPTLASLLLGLFATLSLVSASAFAQAEPAPTEEEIQVADGATEYMVAMRDGIHLATNVYQPEGDGPWPAILVRTPYGKDKRGMSAQYRRFTSKGYLYVVQDTRGKFRSEGDYRPFETDMNDGYDTVEWLAALDLCDGKVGMSGASAMGITTNLAAAADPPHLVAGFAVVAPHSMWEEATFIGGVFKEADTGNWMKAQGAGDQVPERKSTVVVGEEELARDLPHLIDNIDIPIYNLGGWYDIFSIGNQTNFTYLQNEGREGARGNQKLLMGPFGHGKLEGDLDYPDGSNLMLAFQNEIRWFDYWLKGIDNGIMDEPAVQYYLMAGARKDQASDKNGWRTAQNWPLDTEEVRLYLGNPGLSEEPPSDPHGATTYTFDPENPVPTVGGANLTLPIGPMDQREIGEREDYVRFETEPLKEDLTVVGRIEVELWASTDVADTDFIVKLVDVYPDGYEALILDAPQRARYRKGRRAEDIEMMEPGEPVLLEIDLWATANVFEKGHKLALHVTSSNHPRFEVNPGTGDPPGKDSGVMKKAQNTVHHSKAYPSALVLPVLKEQPAKAVAETTADR